MIEDKIVICWLRRDLRLEDNTALANALNSGLPVLPLFIFDTNILDKLEDKSDKRVDLIRQILVQISTSLQQTGSSLLVKYGKPEEVFEKLSKEYHIQGIYTNRDYEPYAISRDLSVKVWANSKQIEFKDYKDQVVFEPGEITKDDGNPYTVFTPFSKVWKRNLTEDDLRERICHDINSYFKTEPFKIPALEEMGFVPTGYVFQNQITNFQIIQDYHKTRDFPGIEGTTHISLHLRFGTVSPRKMVKIALENNETWLNELIWREFFMHVMWFFPKVESKPFNPKYEFIEWSHNEELFRKWCEGKTGYPIVDAGMRELNTTGWMHNRVRMITANFLTKILMIDWKWGEAWFAKKLLDYDLALNNGNWQWSAGCGCDAAPYFRIFNPTEQIRKFDPEYTYIRKWVPELETFEYPEPLVDYQIERNKNLEKFKKTFDSIKNT